MTEVKILVKGYAKPTGNGEFRASPTTTLIKDSGKLILVDPGASKAKLLNALKKENLKPEDIDLIFLTHYHPDHLLNTRLFPDKDILDGTTVYRDDEEFEITKKIIGNIKIIPTPGHAFEHASLIVDSPEGKICVAGDLWWWEDGKQKIGSRKNLLNTKDIFVKDKKALLKSRKKILDMADYIIPGHGVMFKVPK